MGRRAADGDGPTKAQRVARAWILLDLPTDSEKEEVRKRYKKLILTAHPDRNPEDPKAQEKFLRIMEAYKELQDSTATSLDDLEDVWEGAWSVESDFFKDDEQLSNLDMEQAFGEFEDRPDQGRFQETPKTNPMKYNDGFKGEFSRPPRAAAPVADDVGADAGDPDADGDEEGIAAESGEGRQWRRRPKAREFDVAAERSQQLTQLFQGIVVGLLVAVVAFFAQGPIAQWGADQCLASRDSRAPPAFWCAQPDEFDGEFDGMPGRRREARDAKIPSLFYRG